MYLQIRLDAEDAAFQRTFIGKSADGPLLEMELPTVIFGMKSAPYLALRTLRHIADSVEVSKPTAARLLRENFYVDDLLGSFHNVDEAAAALQEIIDALKLGKFELKKIASSHQDVLKDIPTEDTLEIFSKDLEDETILDDVKVLGIMWERNADHLHYKVKMDDPDEVITKRKATSVVARIYDPTGCLNPALLGGKILIQEMWRLTAAEQKGKLEEQLVKGKNKDDWDAPLPKDLNNEFRAWQSNGSRIDSSTKCQNKQMAWTFPKQQRRNVAWIRRRIRTCIRVRSLSAHSGPKQ